jgi:hypothetical protein
MYTKNTIDGLVAQGFIVGERTTDTHTITFSNMDPDIILDAFAHVEGILIVPSQVSRVTFRTTVTRTLRRVSERSS